MALPFSLYLLLSFIISLKTGRTQLDNSPLLVIHHFSGHVSAVVPTAHCQYSFLKTVPVFHFLPSQHSKQCQLSSTFLVGLLLFLSGDIQINPGPTIQLSLCTLNIRSLFAENRSVFISDLLTTDNIDIFAFTETFQNAATTTPSQVFDITPKNFQFLGQPRSCHGLHSGKSSSAIIGGGLGFLVKDVLCADLVSLSSFTSFEALAVGVKSHGSKLAIYNIYRPPDSSAYAKPFSTFMSEFCSFLSSVATSPDEFLITGDFNLHIRWKICNVWRGRSA